MKMIKGDLIRMANEGEIEGLIVHGCNCFNKWGKGFVVQLKESFYEAYLVDMKTLPGDRNKLGNYTHAKCCRKNKSITIINAYTQYYYGGGAKRQTDYRAIGSVFRKISKDFPGEHIYYPLIGAGNGKGDWVVISGIIDRELEGRKHTCIIWEKDV